MSAPNSAADQDLDHLIFNDKKVAAGAVSPTRNANAAAAASVTSAGTTGAHTSLDQPQDEHHDGDSDSDEKKQAAAGGKFDRASLANVLPVDKIKNGASTATKVLGQGFSMFKEKSSAALEAAKSSNAGQSVAGGLNRAAAVGSEQIGKIQATDAYKKSSSFASTQLERTSVVASGALEKARAGASIGLEKAKAGASTGFETIKSKVSSEPGKKGGE